MTDDREWTIWTREHGDGIRWPEILGPDVEIAEPVVPLSRLKAAEQKLRAAAFWIGCAASELEPEAVARIDVALDRFLERESG
jgi:hypothetical protein